MISAGRKLACAGLVSVLAGCAQSSGGNEYAQIFQAFRQSLNGSFRDTGITLKEASAIPYASMGWRLNGGRENLIVLATDSGHEQLWTSRAHVVLVTQNGFIRQTVGLPQDLTSLQSRQGPTLTSPAQALLKPYTEQRVADFKDLKKYGAIITCQGRLVGNQNVQILGKTIRTRRVDESCTSSSLDWTFRNSFWLDGETGFVWRSVQTIHPGVTLETKIFRPPG